MNHLDEIAVEELQRALDAVEGKKTTERLLAAIAYENGVTQTELAEWYGVQRRTVYNWLVRLDTDGPLEAAVTDTAGYNHVEIFDTPWCQNIPRSYSR